MAGRPRGAKDRVSELKPFQVRFNDGWQVKFNDHWIRAREVSIQAAPVFMLRDGILHGLGVVTRRGQDIVITS